MTRHPETALSRLQILLLATGALLWSVAVLASSVNKSASVDEVPHIASGFSIVHRADFRMNPEHPPLVKAISVLPAYFFYRPDLRVEAGNRYLGAWSDGDQNHYGYYVLFQGGKDPLRLLFMCRIVPTLIGLLGGFIVFQLGRSLTGSAWVGMIAAALLLFYPEYAGHSRLLTMDVGTVAACGAVSWCSLRWWRRPGLRSSVVFAVVAAVGSQVKLPVTVFTAFTLLTIILLSSVRALRDHARKQPRLSVQLVLFVAAAVYFACWAAAGFRFSYLPHNAVPPEHTTFIPPFHDASGVVVHTVNWLWEQRLLPESTLATLAIVSSFTAREMFLLGEQSLTGWYHYFFVTIATKTSLVYLAALAAAVISLLSRWRLLQPLRRTIIAEHWMLFLLPFGMLFILFCLSRTNIGHRHVLFAYIPFSVIIARCVTNWLKKPGITRLLGSGVLVLHIAVFASTFPHFETYFNELIRTPYRGHYIVRDSNVDWGQDLPLVRKTLGGENINFAAMSFNRPESFGISRFNWILRHYPFAINMPPATIPDPELPSVISLNVLPEARLLYPELYARKPDVLLNSLVLFMPRSSVLN